MKYLLNIALTISMLYALQGSVVHAQISESVAEEQAKTLYQRLNNGKVPDTAIWQQMKDDLIAGQPERAAMRAIESDSKGFYNMLRDMFTKLSKNTSEANAQEDLTDFTALIAGVARDNLKFTEIFRDNAYVGLDRLTDYYIDDDTPQYVRLNDNPYHGICNYDLTTNQDNRDDSCFNYRNADGSAIDVSVPGNEKAPPIFEDGGQNAQYSTNDHYLAIGRYPNWIDLLRRVPQSTLYSNLGANVSGPIDEVDVAGVFTTRDYSRPAYLAGTNRRPFEQAVEIFWCKTLEELSDTTAPDFKVRRDVDRAPEGDEDRYQTYCRGCHGGMDAMVGSFAYFDFVDDTLGNGKKKGRLAYLPPSAINGGGYITLDNPEEDLVDFYLGRNLQPDGDVKKNWRGADRYPPGVLVTNNGWENFWTNGPNAALGWRLPPDAASTTAGVGAGSFAKVFSYTKQFSNCMAERAFRRVCNRAPDDSDDEDAETISNQERSILEIYARGYEEGYAEFQDFGTDGQYNIKTLFAKAAGMCFGKE